MGVAEDDKAWVATDHLAGADPTVVSLHRGLCWVLQRARDKGIKFDSYRLDQAIAALIATEAKATEAGRHMTFTNLIGALREVFQVRNGVEFGQLCDPCPEDMLEEDEMCETDAERWVFQHNRAMARLRERYLAKAELCGMPALKESEARLHEQGGEKAERITRSLTAIFHQNADGLPTASLMEAYEFALEHGCPVLAHWSDREETPDGDPDVE